MVGERPWDELVHAEWMQAIRDAYVMHDGSPPSLGIMHKFYEWLMLDNKGEPTVSYPDKLPDPTTEYHEFVIALMQCPDVTNLTHYRTAGGKNARLWTIAIALKIAEAMEDEVVEVGVITVDGDERVNYYKPTDGAREFWKNGLEEKMSPEEILKGWKAMMSITKDGKASGEDASA